MQPGPRTPLTLTLTAIAAGLLLLGQAAMAQTEAPKADKSLERAQKAADAVFHWIKLNGDKGASRQQPAAAPTPAAAPAPRKPAPAPVAAAPKPAPAPAVTAAPNPAPVAVAVAPDPEPEPERAPVVLAMASPTPAPTAPMAAAARAVEPPPAPVEEAEVPLKLLSRVNPTIPRQLQQQSSFRDGFARVKFTVAPNGSVSKAETLKASHSRLGLAAVDAVKQWRFEPIAAPREVAIEFAFSNADE